MVTGGRWTLIDAIPCKILLCWGWKRVVRWIWLLPSHHRNKKQLIMMYFDWRQRGRPVPRRCLQADLPCDLPLGPLPVGEQIPIEVREDRTLGTLTRMGLTAEIIQAATGERRFG